MKKLFTLSAAILCGIYTQAQQTKQVNPLVHKAAKTLPAPVTGGKTTANDSRPIAVADYTYGISSFEVQDSSIIFYTGNNGFDYATGEWKYDSTKGWSYNTSTSQWEDYTRNYQVLSGNRIMSSLYRQWTGSQWEDQEKYSYTYTNGYIGVETDQTNSGSGLENDRRSTNTYNSDSKITENVVEQWNASTNQWENNHRTTFHFNTNKLQDTMTEYSWNSSAGQWVSNSRNINTYTNNLHTGVLQQSFLGGTWNDNTRSVLAYDTKGNQTSFEFESWNSGTASWDKIYKETYDYNSLNDKVSEVHMSTMGGSAYINTNKTNYTYDQYHRILTEETQTWDATAGQWIHTTASDYLIRYYYEAYTNGIEDLVANNAALSVFPVPAKNTVNLLLDFKEKQAIAAAIYDVTGKVVRQWSDNSGTQYSKIIDVSALPAGKYIIKVAGNKERAVKTISVVH